MYTFTLFSCWRLIGKMVGGIDRKEKVYRFFLLGLISTLTVVNFIKHCLVSIDIDEQYAVTLAYRLAQGDRFLRDMWEPHQMSAIIPAIFVKVWLVINGNTNCLVVYLRIIALLFQSLVAVVWFSSIKHYSYNGAFFSAVIIMNTLPKNISNMEFSNLQVWYLLLTISFLTKGIRDKRVLYSFFAGVWMCLEILDYPSTIIIFPAFLLAMRKYKKHVATFCGTCIGAGVSFILYLNSYMSINEMVTYIGQIVKDGEHSQSLSYRMVGYLWESYDMICHIAIYTLLAMAVVAVKRIIDLRNKKEIEYRNYLIVCIIITNVFSLLDQVRHWLILNTPIVHPQYYYAVFCMSAGAIALIAGSKREEDKLVQKLCFHGGLLSLVSVLALTNLDLKASLVHLLPTVLIFVVMLVAILDDSMIDFRRYANELVIVYVVVVCIGQIWLVRVTGGLNTNLTFPKQKSLVGSSKSIYYPYAEGYAYNINAVFLKDNVSQGEKVLYLGNQQLLYLVGNYRICAPSTISTPTYDDVFMSYYNMNPEKLPDVIFIDSDYIDMESEGILAIISWFHEKISTEEISSNGHLYLLKRCDNSEKLIE